jgi:hypothetical protein
MRVSVLSELSFHLVWNTSSSQWRRQIAPDAAAVSNSRRRGHHRRESGVLGFGIVGADCLGDLGVEELRRLPAERISEVEDVTGAALALASPTAGLVSATIFAVDGGLDRLVTRSAEPRSPTRTSSRREQPRTAAGNLAQAPRALDETWRARAGDPAGRRKAGRDRGEGGQVLRQCARGACET